LLYWPFNNLGYNKSFNSFNDDKLIFFLKEVLNWNSVDNYELIPLYNENRILIRKRGEDNDTARQTYIVIIQSENKHI
jgi:hypothetical protein